MPPPSYPVDRDEQRRELEEAKRHGQVILDEVKAIRSEAVKANTQVKKTLRENHFADLMMRAMESR